jgi:hypothetical protein
LKKQLKIYDSGYDSQFMYFIAFDPFLQRFSDQLQIYEKWIDHPPFRYGRIGFPLLVTAASLNRPERFPEVMVLLIVTSSFVAAFFMAKIALFFHRSPLWSLLLIAIPSFSVSLRFGLPEMIAAAFLLGGILFYLNQKYVAAALFLAISLLVRETALVAVVIVVASELFLKKNLRAACLLSSSVVPFVLWRGFLAWRMFPDYGMKAIPIFSGNLALPFSGFVRLWSDVVQGRYTGGSIVSAWLYPFLLICCFVFVICYLRKNKSAMNFVFLGYGVLALSLSYLKFWIYMPNGERVTFEAFLFLMIAFLALPKDQSKSCYYAVLVFFILTIVYDLFFLSAASSFRAGLYGGFFA